jgi:hypothetical protein
MMNTWLCLAYSIQRLVGHCSSHHNKSLSSSIVSPISRIIVRNVPFAISLWSGTVTLRCYLPEYDMAASLSVLLITYLLESFD